MGPDAAQVVKIGDEVLEDSDLICAWCGETEGFLLTDSVPDIVMEYDTCSWPCCARLLEYELSKKYQKGST